MRFFFTLILYFLANSIHLNAHELWLEAKQYQVEKGNKIIIDIKVGQDLIGESYPYLTQETEKLILQTQDGQKSLNQIDGDYPAIQQKLKITGTNYISYQSNKEFLEYKDYKTFLEFAHDYDLTYNKNNKDIPKEIYQRFAKIIFNYEKGKFFKSKPNLEFEIINQNNPYENNISQIQILLENQPFKKKKFIVFFRNNDEFKKQIHETDENGFAKIQSSKKGLYLISAVHLETLNFVKKMKYKADYYSKWASLTFRKN